MKLRITILKYHSWYLYQISLQIVLLPIQKACTNHPFFLPFHYFSFGLFPSSLKFPFFCSFSVSGGELFKRVADADYLTEKEASFYMYQLLQGLQYMHNKNIVHLDIKVTEFSSSWTVPDNWSVSKTRRGWRPQFKPERLEICLVHFSFIALHI